MRISRNQFGTLALTLGFSGLVGFGIFSAFAQEIKQLSEPAAPVKIQSEDGSVVASEDAETAQANGTNSSYSVVIENKTDKDGKTIQTKKVWKNGVLTEETEKTLEPGENGDAAIELSDGEIAPGMILRSEQFGDFPFKNFGFDEEQAKQFDEQMKQFDEQMKIFSKQSQSQIEALRKQFGNLNQTIPGNENGAPSFQIVPENATIPANIPLSEYWIGAAVEPLPEIVASQIPVDEGEGVLILQVVPNSPSEKAGLKKFDVVVKIGDDSVKNVLDIGTILDRDGDKVQKVEFYRKGKLETVELTPEKRPEQSSASSFQIVPGDGKQSIRVVRPGMIIPGVASAEDEGTAGDEKATETAENAETTNGDNAASVETESPEAQTTENDANNEPKE